MDIPKGNLKADLVYKNTSNKELMLTFLPPITEKYENAPVYFIITGGGWQVAKRQSMFVHSAQSVEALRIEGFAVVSIDYRVYDDGVVMSDIITDCFDAARYIAHFADVLKIDKDCFVLSGHSAGAHLALMLSYAPENQFKGDYEFDDAFNVKAVAAMSPPTILHDLSGHNMILDRQYAGCDTKEERERTSPVTYVTDSCPATLLCAGTSDYLVFAKSSENLYKLLKENDVSCDLKLSVGGGHLFEKIHNSIEPSISMAQMQDEIVNFILKHMER